MITALCLAAISFAAHAIVTDHPISWLWAALCLLAAVGVGELEAWITRTARARDEHLVRTWQERG